MSSDGSMAPPESQPTPRHSSKRPTAVATVPEYASPFLTNRVTIVELESKPRSTNTNRNMATTSSTIVNPFGCLKSIAPSFNGHGYHINRLVRLHNRFDAIGRPFLRGSVPRSVCKEKRRRSQPRLRLSF